MISKRIQHKVYLMNRIDHLELWALIHSLDRNTELAQKLERIASNMVEQDP